MPPREKAVLFDYKGLDDLTYPEGHPFRPERAGMLREILGREGVLGEPWHSLVEAAPATEAELAGFHRADYLAALAAADQGGFDPSMIRYGLGTPDCPVFDGVLRLAALSAGASLAGARIVASGGARMAFNPIGGFHHAGPATAEGFCYINDVVLACTELAESGARVACVDLDAHHGNGTETAFLDDRRVLTFSTHQSGKTLYPGTGDETELGRGEGRGYNVNVPLLPGAGDDAMRRAIEEVAMPVLEAYRPDFVALEIGMDPLFGDPLAQLRMTNNALADAADRVRSLGVPMIVFGGGGYMPRDTARGWALVWSVLNDAEQENPYLGLIGGVMLGSAEYASGGNLRDVARFTPKAERAAIDADLDRVIAFHREHLFGIHGIARPV
jgi:acetoin utilization protein AcuC